ncbi:type II secretion system protein [Oceanobacillus sp. CAU 1775]
MKKMMKRWMENFKKDERGLTLVELLAVVVILAIVGLIAFVSIGNVIDNSKKDAHIANATQMISAAELYEASGNSIDDLTSPVNATDLDTVNANDLIDPWNNEVTGEDGYNFTITATGEGAEREILVTGEHDNCAAFTTAKTRAELAAEGRTVCDD